jgi:hypothetical protein
MDFCLATWDAPCLAAGAAPCLASGAATICLVAASTALPEPQWDMLLKRGMRWTAGTALSRCRDLYARRGRGRNWREIGGKRKPLAGGNAGRCEAEGGPCALAPRRTTTNPAMKHELLSAGFVPFHGTRY